MNQVTFDVKDMVCGGCAQAVRSALGTLAGVTSVAVDIAAKEVTVTYAGETPPDVPVALHRVGFTVTPHSK